MRQPLPPRGILTSAPPREHHRAIPDDPALAEHVAHFWWVAWDTPQPLTATTLSHPTIHVVVEDHRAAIVGVPRGVFRRRLPPRGRVFGVKFRPAAFSPWIAPTPIAALTDRRVPLAPKFGPTYAREIRAAATFADCCAIATAVLAPRTPALPADIRALRDLVERMAIDPAITRVEQAAALLACDARTLQRRFARHVGPSPKWVLQRYRLHEAAAQLARPDAPSLAAIAARLGYFDQAHFAREFRAVVGAPPSAYLVRPRP